MKITGFCDLNIPFQSEKNIKLLCEELVNLNYRIVALNQTVEEENLDNTEGSSKKKKKGSRKEIVPEPPSLSFLDDLKKKLQIIHRITIVFSDPQYLQKVNQSANIKKYDLISVIPTTLDAFQLACASKDIDLISFDASNKCDFRFNRKMYGLGVSHNVYFEIPYAPAILNATSRKNTIQMAHLYHTFGKSKNVIISSKALNHFHLRGPYDVMNLGLLFGLSEEQSKNAATNNCRTLLIRAQGRKFGKTSMTMEIHDLRLDESQLPEEEGPSIKRLRVDNT
uniref:Uncharacterized protein n=2 Tax=Clastoptera arizonana TaxID=38151 RepID=A0A1B6DUH7_9HEMI